MAVNVYDELEALGKRVAALEAKLAPKCQVAPVTYFFPGVRWDLTLAKKPALTIFNPGSGPGPAQSASYVAQVGKCKAAGVKVLGYVYTDYGNRPLAEVKHDIDKHIAWYGVDGIFLDETANTLAQLPYYANLYAYLKATGRLVAINPGTKTLEAYMGACDYAMVSETDWTTYKGQTRNAWEAAYPGRLWHCIHTCPAAEMPAAVALAKQRGAGLLYVTEDVMANPYDTLPTYWDALCLEIAKS